MMKVLEFLFGGMPAERRLSEMVAWAFPGLVFLAAFPKELVGMNSFQWFMTSLALAMGSRVYAGFPMIGLKLKENKVAALRALTSVTIGVTALGSCAMSQEDFGWNWKVYAWTVFVMSIVAFLIAIKEAGGMMKRMKKQGIPDGA